MARRVPAGTGIPSAVRRKRDRHSGSPGATISSNPGALGAAWRRPTSASTCWPKANPRENLLTSMASNIVPLPLLKPGSEDEPVPDRIPPMTSAITLSPKPLCPPKVVSAPPS